MLDSVEENRFECDVLELCEYCVMETYPFSCCYQQRQATDVECDLARCSFHKYCPASKGKEYIRELAKNVSDDFSTKSRNGSTFQEVASSLSSPYIPEVRPMGREKDEAIRIVKESGIPVIAVSLSKFYRGVTETSSLRKALKAGLHKFMGFEGEILLSTDVQNPLCDKFTQNPRYFKRIAENLSPDYLTTLDTYSYYNIPACISRIKMLQILAANHALMDLTMKVIGLVVGGAVRQVLQCARQLQRMGCRVVCYPVYEMRRSHDTYGIRARTEILKTTGLPVALLSCTPGTRKTERVYANYYSSFSWFSIFGKQTQPHLKRKERLIKLIKLAQECSRQATWTEVT